MIARPLSIGSGDCRDYTRASRLEWLETNGTGAFGMGTVAGANTRRYHGLLVASLRPPAERYVLVAKVDEALIPGAIELGANQFPGVVHPTGVEFLSEFRLDPYPIWTYEAGGVRIEKRLFLVGCRQTAVVVYRTDRACRLRVRPFLAFRDYHSLAKASEYFDGRVRADAGVAAIRPYAGLPELRFHFSGGEFAADGSWYYSFEYLEELERGFEFHEDLYTPGAFELELTPESPGWLVATIEEGAFDAAAVERLEAERRARPAAGGDSFLAALDAAAEQFLVKRADGHATIIAGYPWFTDWGRDTMISLPGLLVARGRLDQARAAIGCFLNSLHQGLIPNRFPDRGQQAEYNTADATLWLFQAVRALGEAGADVTFFYDSGKEIIDWHQRGTLHGIGVDPEDGLLAAGAEGMQLTWMDAKVGDWVVTPRRGKPVEINALWYNALRLMEQWAKERGETAAALAYGRAARQAQASFAAKFWNAGGQCLYDVITPQGPDAKLRPNQIFAVSLPFPLLRVDQQRAVVKAVEAALLTPVGLRTLAPDDPDYQPHYRGDARSRDAAYHQGTAWPWLLGPFVEAYLKAFGRSKKNAAYCRGLVRGLEPELSRGCLGTIGEIYEGAPPHRAVGAPAQAWSVAEALRVLYALREPSASAGGKRGRRIRQGS